jgi:hypothetical protein
VCDKPVRSLVLDPISTTRKRDVSPEKLGQPFSGGFYSKVHDKISQSVTSMDSRNTPNTHSSEILNSQSLLSSWASPQRGSQMPLNARPEGLTLSAGTDFRDLALTDSPSPSVTKISSDFAIMRSSVDLPPLDNQGSGKASANALKQRVRVSAGGGLGPTYTLDTR